MEEEKIQETKVSLDHIRETIKEVNRFYKNEIKAKIAFQNSDGILDDSAAEMSFGIDTDLENIAQQSNGVDLSQKLRDQRFKIRKMSIALKAFTSVMFFYSLMFLTYKIIDFSDINRRLDKFEEIVLTRPLSLGDRDNPLADLAKQ